ncbi:MAG TPA: hypothetical protein VK497_05390 [Candidatus Saccharimonadales bacterium]|nr:hypothetical protein [Candidatus Saccharimonadales bacterium]
MQKLINIFHQNFPEARRRDVVAWLFIIVGGSFVGLSIAYFSFRQGIDFGDGSTFFSFAHNLASGEAIYKDFIHFRTPGSYFLQSFFIDIFGDQQSSVRFALKFESHVLYTFFFALAAAVFLRFKHVLIGALSILLIVMLPPYAQLRTVLALVAVVLYIHAYRVVKARSLWLVGSGVFVGLAFTFGQEAALMAIVAIGLMEIIQAKTHGLTTAMRRIGMLVLGTLLGALPLLLYVLIQSDLPTFLYYTLYYAFVLQPQGMDLVYPPFGHTNLIFYMVFILYFIIFYIFYSSKKLGIVEGILLVFGIMRLVTLLGRSDIGHLLFILPEVLFLTLYAITNVKAAWFTRAHSLRFVPYGIALFVSFYAAINGSGMILIVSAVIIYLAFYFKKPFKQRDEVIKDANAIVLVVITSCFSILAYMLYPSFASTINTMSTRGLTNTQVSGLNVTPEVYAEVTAVSETVKSLHPTTIFSYPIQPYYYSLAPKHAARFMTFEPQTTEKEQDQTIEDLKRTRPEVILYDPVQAESLSVPLGRINAYIRSNYKVERVVEYSRTFWIMMPNDKTKPIISEG